MQQCITSQTVATAYSTDDATDISETKGALYFSMLWSFWIKKINYSQGIHIYDYTIKTHQLGHQ